jgi:hypothetical protein
MRMEKNSLFLFHFEIYLFWDWLPIFQVFHVFFC